MDIKEAFEFGNIGERDIEKWLIFSRNCAVFPAYEAERDNRGARIFGLEDIVCPDLLVFPNQSEVQKFPSCLWMEVKRKSTFSWYRRGENWVTGIDLHYFSHYIQASYVTALPVWLVFWHNTSIFDTATKAHSPMGLFGNDIFKLQDNYSHKSDKIGKGGMIYFGVEHLIKLASVEEVELAGNDND